MKEHLLDIAHCQRQSGPASCMTRAHFRSGPLQGQTVNIKWYLKREGTLDTTESTALDYYLVLTGSLQRR